MGARKMHDNEVHTDTGLVRRLLEAQYPQWAGLPVVPVGSAGTDNALYRLGTDMVVRLPRIGWAVAQVRKEHAWLPRLAPHMPVAVPTPLAMGEPGEGYPWHWSVYDWLPGESAQGGGQVDMRRAATTLAAFIKALQAIDTTGAPQATEDNLRGAPLAARDAPTREAIGRLDGAIDAKAALHVWEEALDAELWDRPPVWFHGDLLPGNLLFKDGALCGVIDFGGAGVGDPACDLMIAWSLLSGAARRKLRETLEVDDATWARGRGHALSQAAIFIPYYEHTNPLGVRTAQRQLHAVLADLAAS